jgi:hypothetical protein
MAIMNARVLSIVVVVIVALVIAIFLVSDPVVMVLSARGLAALVLIPLFVGWLIGYTMSGRRNRPARVETTPVAPQRP